MLAERINNDLKECMKNKDSFKLSVIRMIKGAMQLEKKDPRAELTDDEMIKVISKQIKMRNDAINEFKKANREDLVSQNEKEIEILNSYLPPKLSDEEVNKILDDAFSLVNPTSSKDMGKIMKEVSSKVAGRADMSVVSTLIKDRLSNL